MKNLFCTLILALSIFITAEAQNLAVKVQNRTTHTWDYRIVEANGGFLNFPSIAPNTAASGVITGPVAFPYTWGVNDVTASCSGSGYTILGVGPSFQVVCGYTVSWTLGLSPLFPFDYVMMVTIQ